MSRKLGPYHRKRSFEKTPEPEGVEPRDDSGRSYVIQKHHATRLHYDLRLEHDGVLLSWAVPKGPSLDPDQKRLAVHVEDHPVEYGGFEGEIPKGEYGGGTVVIWDRGAWEPYGDVDEMMKKGEMKFAIHGERLRGDWAMIRLKDDEKNWIFFKERDVHAVFGDNDGVIQRLVGSVLTEGPPRNALDPLAFRPQLAELVDEPPAGKQWVHEVKFDGYRMLAWNLDGEIQLVTRNGNDWTDRFPALAEALEETLPTDSAIDGEIVVLGDDGLSSFSGLQNWLKTGKGFAPVYFAFDLVALDGQLMGSAGLLTRKAKLATLIPRDHPLIRYSEHLAGEGPAFFKEVAKAGLEGIVSKRADSRYSQTRNKCWLKCKSQKQEEFLIGGYTKPSGERSGLGAVLVGQYDQKGALVYHGKVGSGFNDAMLRDLTKRLKELEVARCPFAEREEPLPKGATFVEPTMVAQVRYTERTPSGTLRHPVFLGLRDDKSAGEVRVERPIVVPNIQITHPERVVYPEVGVTKQQLADYAALVAPLMLPFVVGRPLALVRCPEGVAHECFFQKHATAGMPAAMMRKTGHEDEEVLVIENEDDLFTLIQFGVIEIHTWGSRFPDVEKPDLMVFDLDTGPGVQWREVIQAAEVMRALLKELGLECFLKLSGGKGFHLAVPIEPGTLDWKEFKGFALQVAEALDLMVPNHFVTVMTKSKRTGRIFIDYLRNGRGATSVAPYSLRTHPEAPASVPIAWEDIRSVESAREYTLLNVNRWLPTGEDPWSGLDAARRPVTEETHRLLDEMSGLSKKKSPRRSRGR